MVSTANKEGGIVRIVQNLTRELVNFTVTQPNSAELPPFPPPPTGDN